MVTGPARSQEPEAAKAAELMESAKGFVDLLAGKDFSNAEKLFDDTMKVALPQEKLQETWLAVVSQAGAFRRQISTRAEDRAEHKVVIVTCEFEKAALDIEVVFDQATHIAGLFLVPAKNAPPEKLPAYIKPSAFLEKEVAVGEGEWALPGTLTLPVGQNSAPVVVLVHGSGPNDRDETVGPNKPFRDLAWGLATNGIAVLRYEKRTRQYAQRIDTDIHLTVKEEVIDDVLSVVVLLRKTPGIDAKRIFVLGHSLGGMLIPRIGVADPAIAGFIVMAGAVRPIGDMIAEQMAYISSLDGVVSILEQGQLDATKQSAADIKNLQPSDVGASANIFGAPASYWLDLRGYHPPATAKALSHPMLILQGERDYQVTTEDFQSWRTALSSRANVSFGSYPKLNHFFMEGEGRSVPAEYDKPGHIAEGVINDIANWIKKVSGE